MQLPAVGWLLGWLRMKQVNSQSAFSGKSVHFNAEAGRFDGVTPRMVEAWAVSYPGLNIGLELTRAECWLICNPEKRPGGDLRMFLRARLGEMARLPACTQ